MTPAHRLCLALIALMALWLSSCWDSGVALYCLAWLCVAAGTLASYAVAWFCRRGPSAADPLDDAADRFLG